MSSIVSFLQKSATPLSADEKRELLNEFSDILNLPTNAVLDEKTIEKLADQDELIALNQQEIGRLNRMIVSHADGIENASIAGLDVLGERARQRRLEGYDDNHDDSLEDLSLVSAALAFIEDARLRASSGGKGYDDDAPVSWPFDKASWKPKPIRRSLVIACALLIAEIEVIDRSEERLRSVEQAAD